MATVAATSTPSTSLWPPPVDGRTRFFRPRYWPAWLLVGWLRASSALPWRLAIRLHKGIGSALWLLLPKRRRIIERNLELAFPDLGRTEIRSLTRKHFQSLAACLAETAFAWFGKVDDSLTEFELQGDEHVYRALASGRGVILYTGHFTSLEICAPILKRSFPLVGFMFRCRRNALLDAMQRRGRQFSAHLSFPSDDARAMVRALKRNAVVWYAPDQCYSRRGSIALTHFGQTAHVTTATCRIARMSGAVIVPFDYYRKPDDSGYVLRFEPPLEQTGSDEECTQRLLTSLEGQIANHPEQYAWTPNRLRNSGIDPNRSVKTKRRALPTLLAILGVTLFITLADNGPFFLNLWDSTRAEGHPLSILVTMGLLVPLSLVLVLAVAVGARLFKATAAALLVVAAAVGYFMSNYGIVIDPSMIRNVVETDVREASPLVTAAALAHIFAFGIAPALAVLWLPLARRGWKRELAMRLGAAVGGTVLFASMIYFNYGPVTFFGHEHHELRMEVNPVYPLYALARYITRADDRPPAEREPLEAWRAQAKPDADKSRLFILVMGETARADRFSVNGYERETNAYTGDSGVVNFPHVSSCGTSTAESLPCIFSQFDRNDFSHAKFAANESLMQTLDRLGIDTLWLDNSTGCKDICNEVDFRDLAGANDPELCRDNVCVDEILLRDFRAAIADDTRDHFVVMHQRGSHGPAYFSDTPDWAKVYLPECNLPSLKSCDPESINNAYDNTIRYTDYFLSRVIDLLETEADSYDTAMLYVSDHGESLGEKGLYLHGLPYSIAPSEQTEVPMMFWASAGFYEREHLDIDCVERAAAQPTTHDAVFHTMLPLFDIMSPAYQEPLDLFSSCRPPPARRL